MHSSLAGIGDVLLNNKDLRTLVMYKQGKHTSCWLLACVIVFATGCGSTIAAQEVQIGRARDLGVDVGILPTGPHNAITDVTGVRVGHQTIMRGDSVRTGVTAILPHGDDVFQNKVSAGVHSANAFGKLAGSTQVDELGNIETPIVLTNTLNVPVGVQAVVRYTLSQPGNEQVRSVNAIVGETNDGFLNDIRGMHVTEADVLAAIDRAASGPVEEGNVGAGTGTVCFGFKGGIGTASRAMPRELGGFTVGVLVQSNFGGVLTINGAPVGRELGRFAFSQLADVQDGDGSCMIVIATDAPISSRNLKRLARRSMLGLARTGSFMSNGSGDYAIAFSTAIHADSPDEDPPGLLSNREMSPLFLAVVEATEEAVYNSLFAAQTMQGHDGHEITALPADEAIRIIDKYQLLNLNDRLPTIGR
ncbi:MAG: P1 family peptidase [Pirellulaceae bacterium]